MQGGDLLDTIIGFASMSLPYLALPPLPSVDLTVEGVTILSIIIVPIFLPGGLSSLYALVDISPAFLLGFLVFLAIVRFLKLASTTEKAQVRVFFIRTFAHFTTFCTLLIMTKVYKSEIWIESYEICEGGSLQITTAVKDGERMRRVLMDMPILNEVSVILYHAVEKSTDLNCVSRFPVVLVT